MPVSGPSSYIPTIDEFISHWSSVNATLGGSPLKLNGNYTLANFTTDRAALMVKITKVADTLTLARGASEARDLLKLKIREKMRQFNAFVRAKLVGSKYQNELPNVPSFTSNTGIWTNFSEMTLKAWTLINADDSIPGFSGPLILNGPYTLADFTADRTALLASFQDVVDTAQQFDGAISDRDGVFSPMKQRMIQYRSAVEGSFPTGNAFINSLPAVTPAPGSTPPPVALSAVWNAGDSKAHLTWDAATDPKITGYEVRACFGGTKYRTQDEAVQANIALGTTHFESNVGLGASGSVVFYKVYTMTATGNEKGSNAVKVTRP